MIHEHDSDSHPNILTELNAIQVSKLVNDKTIAVLVLGACENHGNHMPFGSDFIMPFELAKRLGKKYQNLVILPPLSYGMSSHHTGFFMTISLSPHTIVKVIQDILQSLVNNRIKRILILNGHDGNIAPIETASRIVKELNPDIVIACLESWWTLVDQIDNSLFDVWEGMGHGGEAETSAMLAVRPDLVDMTLAPEKVLPNMPKQNIWLYWKFNELTTTGTTGAPRNATVHKGIKIMEILEQVLLNFIAELDNNGWKYGTALA